MRAAGRNWPRSDPDGLPAHRPALAGPQSMPGQRMASPKSPAAGAARSVPCTGVYGLAARPASSCLEAWLNAYRRLSAGAPQWHNYGKRRGCSGPGRRAAPCSVVRLLPSQPRVASAGREVGVTYLPIEQYGIIGDLESVALVGINGSIDWYCFPRIDSPSVFGGLLDHDHGGRFQICPTDKIAANKQLYFPDTNVLITRFLSPDGVGEL